MMNIHLPFSTNWSQQTNEQIKVIQEVVSPEVPKPNHAVINKKRDQKQFSLEKGLEERKKINPTLHSTSRWTVLQNSIIDSSILQEVLSSVSSVYHGTEKKQM